MKLDAADRRDLVTFLAVTGLMLVLSPGLAVWSVIIGSVTVGASVLTARLTQWPYARTLLAVGGGLVLGPVPYFVLAAVLIFLNLP